MTLMVLAAEPGKPTFRVCPFGLSWDGWTMRAVYEASSPPRVTAIVAMAHDAMAKENMVSAFMYVRTDDSWTTQAWIGANPEEVFEYIKTRDGIEDSQKQFWGTTPSPDAMLAPEIAGDQMRAREAIRNIVKGPVSTEMAEMLVAPYSFSTGPIGGNDCHANQQLSVIARTLEWTMTQTFADEDSTMLVTEAAGNMVQHLNTCRVSARCPRTEGPFVVAPPIDTGRCNWTYLGSSRAPVAGGYLYTCRYEARRYFKMFQSGPVTTERCRTYICTQVNTGYSSSTDSCTVEVENGTAFNCPAIPSCMADPPSGSTACAATSPSTWLGWSPPCP